MVPLRVSVKSDRSKPETLSLKVIVVMPTPEERFVPKAVRVAVGGTKSPTHNSVASARSELPSRSAILDPAARRSRRYVPLVPVRLVRSSRYWLGIICVTSFVIGTTTPLRVRMKSVRSTPVTASLKLIVTRPACVARGSGVTSTISALGATPSEMTVV